MDPVSRSVHSMREFVDSMNGFIDSVSDSLNCISSCRFLLDVL